MNPTALSTALVLTAVTQLSAQQDPSLRYTIETKSEIETERQIFIDGEEMPGRGGGRRGFGGGGPSKSSSKLVFDEGTGEGGTWRRYLTAEGSTSRAGRDGEPIERTVASALAGKQVFFAPEGVAFENDADGEKLDERLVRNVPSATDLAGLVPATLEADAEFEIDDAMRSSIRSLLHPIRAVEQPRAAEDEPEPEQRGRRGGRGGGWDRMPASVNDAALQVLGSEKLAWKGTGRVASIDEQDGARIARVEFDAEVTGEGTPSDLGLGLDRLRRGRRGGGGGGGVDGEAKAKLNIRGVALVDVASRAVHSLTLDGSIEASSETVSMRNMRGEEAEVEVVSETSGKFSVNVSCTKTPPKVEKQ